MLNSSGRSSTTLQGAKTFLLTYSSVPCRRTYKCGWTSQPPRRFSSRDRAGAFGVLVHETHECFKPSHPLKPAEHRVRLRGRRLGPWQKAAQRLGGKANTVKATTEHSTQTPQPMQHRTVRPVDWNQEPEALSRSSQSHNVQNAPAWLPSPRRHHEHPPRPLRIPRMNLEVFGIGAV